MQSAELPGGGEDGVYEQPAGGLRREPQKGSAAKESVKKIAGRMSGKMELAVMHMSGAYLAQNFYREPLGCPDGAGQGAESRSASDGKTPGTESRGA